MEKVKKILPSILLIAFELVVGILLLINPISFTVFVFIAFGCVLIVCSVIMLIRYLKDRKAAQKAALDARGKKGKKEEAPQEPVKVSVLPLIAAIATFVFGAVFAFGAYPLTTAVLWLPAILYGAVMIVKGIFKIADYISLHKEGEGVSPLFLISGILSIILGVVILIFTDKFVIFVYIIAGIVLLIEGVLDIAALILGRRIAKQFEEEKKAEELKKLKEERYDLDNFAE